MANINKSKKTLNTNGLAPSKEIAKQVGYTNDYIARLCRFGNIQGKKIGNVWYVDISSLESFIAQKQKKQVKQNKELSSYRKKEYRKNVNGDIHSKHTSIKKIVPIFQKTKNFRNTIIIVFAVGTILFFGSVFARQYTPTSTLKLTTIASNNNSIQINKSGTKLKKSIESGNQINNIIGRSSSKQNMAGAFSSVSEKLSSAFSSATNRIIFAVKTLIGIFIPSHQGIGENKVASSTKTKIIKNKPKSTEATSTENFVIKKIKTNSNIKKQRAVLGINTGIIVRNSLNVRGGSNLAGRTNVNGLLNVGGTSFFNGIVQASGGINTNNKDVNAGSGRVFASNIINTISAGSNITISGTPQNPIISAKSSKNVVIATGSNGTVTSVNASGGSTGLSFSGGPVVDSGTLTLSGILGISNGGTGTATAGVTNGIEYYDGSALTNSKNLIFTGTRLGIGTTSPVAQLSVSGASILDGSLAVSGSTSLAHATTTSLSIINATSTLLKTDLLGRVIPAVANVDYATPGAITGYTNWHIVNGVLTPTTTIGVQINASSTIGDGAQNGGLTIYGGATTTGSAHISGALTLGNALSVSNGGTGSTSFGQGWIYSTGGANVLSASTSPTVNYITATSTTATSTIAGGLAITGGGLDINALNCSSLINGGKLTVDASGHVICGD
ncbi:hypothetical protein MNBD_CPR01-592, partial [hydrothermal vent metagenome]